jgi:hypothetical protein
MLSGQIENKTIYQKEYRHQGNKVLSGLGELQILEHPLTKDRVFAKVLEFQTKQELKQAYVSLMT